MNAARRIAKEEAAGERVTLTPLRAAHAAALFPLQNDWEVMRMLAEAPWPLALADVEEFAKRQRSPDRGSDDFAILLAGEPVGVCGVKHPGTGMPPRRMPRLGYWVGRPFWGRGIATDALSELLHHTFAHFPHEVVGAGVFVDNAASRRVLEKLGFIRVRGYPTPCRSRGEDVPVDDMNLTRDAWAAGGGR